MKRLLINLPFILLFFFAGYWRGIDWLQNLAFAGGMILVCMGGLGCAAALLMGADERRKFIAKEWPRGRQRHLSSSLAICLGAGLGVAGHPIMAGFYGLFAVLSFAALRSADTVEV